MSRETYVLSKVKDLLSFEQQVYLSWEDHGEDDNAIEFAKRRCEAINIIYCAASATSITEAVTFANTLHVQASREFDVCEDENEGYLMTGFISGLEEVVDEIEKAENAHRHNDL